MRDHRGSLISPVKVRKDVEIRLVEVVVDDNRLRVVSTIFTLQDAQNNPDLIMGTLNILGHYARVLIDCGATHSIISHTFAQTIQLHPTPFGYELEFSMPKGETCCVSWVYPGCPVLVEDVVMPANLVILLILMLFWERIVGIIIVPIYIAMRRWSHSIVLRRSRARDVVGAWAVM